jgi:3-deoxy-D-manno-octulosonic-acid transferase
LLNVWQGLKKLQPDARLVLVPRHMERGLEVKRELEQNGVRVVLRSGCTDSHAPLSDNEVLVVDSTGELHDVYGIATVVFVGKSLMSKGGQNILEPAALSKPVVVGPYMDNFETIMTEFLEADAVIQIKDAAELDHIMRHYLTDPKACAEMGARAKRLVDSKRGSVEKVCQKIFSDHPASL